MKTRIAAVAAVIILLLVGVWVWRSRLQSTATDESAYSIRATHLQLEKADRGLTPAEQAELDELNRRIAKIKADKLK